MQNYLGSEYPTEKVLSGSDQLTCTIDGDTVHEKLGVLEPVTALYGFSSLAKKLHANNILYIYYTHTA